mgnify:CR=1 FL=1
MLASAKINLDLRITGRRDDGYHLLDSIVAFTDFGDELTAELSDQLEIEISGPFASDLEVSDNNLVLKAAKCVCDEVGVEANIKFHLVKNLPVSSGIGGGSADAAAAMKLTCELLSLNIDDTVFQKLAVQLGADVPVCLVSRTSHMCGIGDEINPLNLQSEFHILLVNPGVSISTPDIFNHYASLGQDFDSQRLISNNEIHLPLIMSVLKDSRNSLQASTCALNNQVLDVLCVLEQTDGVLLNRMSGSGATCFALYKTLNDCARAAEEVQRYNASWWVQQTRIG